MTLVHHEDLGDCYRHRPMVEFDRLPISTDTPSQVGVLSGARAGVRAGVDAESLLTELGYSKEKIDALFE